VLRFGRLTILMEDAPKNPTTDDPEIHIGKTIPLVFMLKTV